MSPKESSLAFDEVQTEAVANVNSEWNILVKRRHLQNTLAYLRTLELDQEQIVRIEGKITVSF